MRKKNTRKAAVIMEYLALLLFIVSAIYIFQFYILRGLSGGWKKAGDVFGHGKQFDPRDYGTHGDGKGTLECFYSTDIAQWVSTRCFEQGERAAGVVCLLPIQTAAEDPAVNTACSTILANCSASNAAYADCGGDAGSAETTCLDVWTQAGDIEWWYSAPVQCPSGARGSASAYDFDVEPTPYGDTCDGNNNDMYLTCP